MSKRAITPTVILTAIDAETRNSRRGVKIDMVPVLVNVVRNADLEKVEGILLTLRERKLIRRDGEDRLWVTEAGREEMKASPAQAMPAPSAVPIEGGFKQPAKVRDTLRPRVGVAPKPVTRQLAAAAMRKARQARQVEQKSAREAPGAAGTEQPSAQPVCHGCVAQVGEFHSPECPAVNAFTAGRIQAIPRDLLDRCAAMHLTLLAQARDAYIAGEPDSDRELSWLLETGEQLLEAGELAQ
ncbi:hypothetical protein HNO53_20655 [Billgrantia antri]|uniref:Uncharacterized protein n=1 Tax=Halomonas sulfidivorans TaxID=2733488 RepID=A0ABX7WKH5_9GAMM|nr:hypothetical protein [Halomonas sulfidivorans]QTP60910.1 hypothetical protein HNO53_20655 [Halomonas sulfidivorans]